MSTKFTVTLQGNVVWIQGNGGNVRCKAPDDVAWQNSTDRVLLLEFTEALAAGTSRSADSVWPFSGVISQTGVVADSENGIVRIDPDATFVGRIPAAGQIIVKYSAAVLDANGKRDKQWLALDPIIIVEH